MRSTTVVFMTIQNIGNAGDSGEIIEGTVSHCVRQQVIRLGAMSIANHIRITFNRSRNDAESRLNRKHSVDEDFLADLDKLMDQSFPAALS